MKKRLLTYLFVTACLMSCIYGYDPDLTDQNDQRLVVDGNIVLGEISTFYFSYMTSLDTYMVDYTPVDMHIEDNEGGVYYPLENSEGHNVADTNKVCVDMRTAPEDRDYRIVFTSRKTGKSYVSSWEHLNEAPQITDVGYQYDENKVYITMSNSGGSDYFKWTYEDLWEFHSDYVQAFSFDEKGEIVRGEPSPSTYWCWARGKSTEFGVGSYIGISGVPSWNNERIYSILRTDNRISSMYKTTIRLVGLNKDSYEYHRNMLNISGMTGSLTAPVPDDMNGNVKNIDDDNEFVVGYVTVEKPQYYSVYLHPIREDGHTLYIEYLSALFTLGTYYSDYEWYSQGFRPVDRYDGKVYWTYRKCVDCRLSGGTIETPEDWNPND